LAISSLGTKSSIRSSNQRKYPTHSAINYYENECSVSSNAASSWGAQKEKDYATPVRNITNCSRQHDHEPYLT